MMHMYIYPMLITFKLNIKQLYRNALIFAVAKFLPNLGILLLCIVLMLLSFYFSTFVGVLLFIFITVSLIGFIINFYVYPILKKYMIDRIKAEDEDEDEYSDTDDEENPEYREDESTEDENIKLLDDSEDNIDINPEHNEQK